MEDTFLCAQEELACEMLLDFAKVFYSDPQNRQAYKTLAAARESQGEEIQKDDVICDCT